jgi:hypothetical protein
MSPDPVTRAAKRQNLLDRIAEALTDWGCPTDIAATRAVALLHFAEEGGWQLPIHDAPPLQGRGSTPLGRDRARAILEHTMAGCRCGTLDALARALPPWEHPIGCPVRETYEAQRAPALGGRSDEHPPPGISTPREREPITSQTKPGGPT